MELDALIEAGLRKALMEPGGCFLHPGRDGETGMFPATAVGKRAAAKTVQEGLIELAKENEPVRLTEKGRERLTRLLNPKTILEDFVRVLEQRQDLARQTLKSVQNQVEQIERLRAGLADLRAFLGDLTLGRPDAEIAKPPSNEETFDGHQLASALLGMTRAILVRHESRSGADMLLCDLWEGLKAARPELTIGQFQDLLRQWHSEGFITLNPWTGPLYQMPRPELALLSGHEVASYVRWSGAANSQARSGTHPDFAAAAVI